METLTIFFIFIGLIWVFATECDPIVGGILLFLFAVWKPEIDAYYLEDETKKSNVSTVTRGYSEIITVDTPLRSNKLKRKDYCPEVPLTYSVVWIEYDGKLTCTMGEPL